MHKGGGSSDTQSSASAVGVHVGPSSALPLLPLGCCFVCIMIPGTHLCLGCLFQALHNHKREGEQE